MAKHARHRVDEGHKQILSALRRAGFRCISTVHYSGWLGDIAVAAGGVTVILEVKPPGWCRPRDDRERRQAEARDVWSMAGGQVDVVTSPDQAIDVVLRIIGESQPPE